jgi:hypothetical protein
MYTRTHETDTNRSLSLHVMTLVFCCPPLALVLDHLSLTLFWLSLSRSFSGHLSLALCTTRELIHINRPLLLLNCNRGFRQGVACELCGAVKGADYSLLQGHAQLEAENEALARSLTVFQIAHVSLFGSISRSLHQSFT